MDVTDLRRQDEMRLQLMEDPTDYHIMKPPTSMPKYITEAVKKPTKVVLDEDTYVKSIENIIERDFFPNIPILKRKLDQLDSVDYYSKNCRLYDESTIGDEQSETNRNLDNFFDKYTSDDNNSFEIIHEKDKLERYKKYNWAFESKYNFNGKDMLHYMNNQILSIEDREKFDLLVDGSIDLINDKPAVPDSWDFKVRNNFMFTPDGIEPKDNIKLLENGTYLHKSTNNTSNKKEVIHRNTNFNNSLENVIGNNLMSPLELPHTPSMMSDSSWDTASVSKSTRDYGLVPMTPSITPGNQSPLMTWGNIAATPLNLEQRSSSPSRFIINDNSKRENLARNLDNKGRLKSKLSVLQSSMQQDQSIPATPLSMASSKHSKISMKSSASTMTINRKVSYLTPAAEALARKLQSIKSSKETPFGGIFNQR